MDGAWGEGELMVEDADSVSCILVRTTLDLMCSMDSLAWEILGDELVWEMAEGIAEEHERSRSPGRCCQILIQGPPMTVERPNARPSHGLVFRQNEGYSSRNTRIPDY